MEDLNRQLTRFPLYTAVSSIVHGVEGLPAALSEVKQLTDYKVIMEEHAPNILFADSISPSQWGAPDTLVAPEQRHGIGTALIKAVLARYPAVRQVQLTTDNTPKTVAFYRSLGFSELSQLGCCGLMICR